MYLVNGRGRFRVKRLGSQFGKEVRKLVFPSPSLILPLPLILPHK